MENTSDLIGKKVFYVEDDLFMSKMVGDKVAAAGFIFLNAVNGEEAVIQISKSEPDLILLDLLLPGKVDGFQVLENHKK